MSDGGLSVQGIKRDRSRSPLGDDDRRRMDRKPASRPKGGRRGGQGQRVHVSNIPYEYKWQDLKDLFRNEVGEVNYVELFKDETGRARGCGIIEFATPEMVQKAIDTMHRYELSGRKLVVKEDTEPDRRKDRQMGPSGGGGGGGGGGYVNQNRMQGMQDMSVGGGSGPSMGGGPVNYGNTYGLSIAFLESLGINGPLNTKVFVANLDYTVDEDQLREVFKVAGKVLGVDLNKDPDTKKSRGFGVIEFEHPVEAVQAISMLHGQWYYDRKMSVRIDRVSEHKKMDASPASKLPAGLKGIGMGLGLNGSPLTDVSTLPTNTPPSVPSGGMGGMGMAGMNQGGMGMGQGQMMGGAASGMGGLGQMQMGGMGGGQQGLMMGGGVDAAMLGGNPMMQGGVGGMMQGGGGGGMGQVGRQGNQGGRNQGYYTRR